MQIYKRGYSLVETLAYVAFVAIIVAVVAYAANALFIANKKIKIVRQIENSAIASLDRVVREIREASDISSNPSESSLDVPNGFITLTIPVSGGNPRTTKFYLSSGKIMVDDNGTPTGQLSLSNVNVTVLKFSKLTSTVSKAIKIVLTIEGPASTGMSETFYATAVMRGSY